MLTGIVIWSDSAFKKWFRFGSGLEQIQLKVESWLV